MSKHYHPVVMEHEDSSHGKEVKAIVKLKSPTPVLTLCLLFGILFLPMLAIPVVLFELTSYNRVKFGNNGTDLLPTSNAAPDWNLVVWQWERAKLMGTARTANPNGDPIGDVAGKFPVSRWPQSPHGRKTHFMSRRRRPSLPSSSPSTVAMRVRKESTESTDCSWYSPSSAVTEKTVSPAVLRRAVICIFHTQVGLALRPQIALRNSPQSLRC